MPGWLIGLRELIAEASPMRRFMLALFVLLPLIALATAYLKFNPPVYRVLYAQLSDRAGGDVITALEQLDIPYRLSTVDGSIEVPADQLHVARYRLAAQGLPKTDDERQDETERAPSFGASSLQEQQRFQRALETDLARSIQKLDVVEIARVHLAIPKVSPFLRDAPPATAAVLVRLRQGSHLSMEQVTTIQTLVAAGVPRMKRTDVQVFDPSGLLLSGAEPEVVQSHRLALEQDLVRRVRAVLTPWLGEDRVSVQVTATLQDSETRQTVEQVRNVVVAGQARPLEKTVRTTRVPEGSIQRIHAVVILGFDASANQRWRAGQLARQALGYQSARGDSVMVYALPVVSQKKYEEVIRPVPSQQEVQASPKPAAIVSIPQVRTQPAPQTQPDSRSGMVWWGWLIGAGGLVLLIVMRWRHGRHAQAPELVMDDFDAELEVSRNQVMANPRVAADVIKLWMRA